MSVGRKNRLMCRQQQQHNYIHEGPSYRVAKNLFSEIKNQDQKPINAKILGILFLKNIFTAGILIPVYHVIFTCLCTNSDNTLIIFWGPGQTFIISLISMLLGTAVCNDEIAQKKQNKKQPEYRAQGDGRLQRRRG